MRRFSVLIPALLIFPGLAAARQGGNPAPAGQGTPGAPCMPGMRMPGCPDTSPQQPGAPAAGGSAAGAT